MNLYAYVGNDPVNAFDPSGTCKVEDGSLTECSITFDEKLTADQLEVAQAWVSAITEIGEIIQSSGDSQLQLAFEDIKEINFKAEDLTRADGTTDPTTVATALDGEKGDEINFWSNAYTNQLAIDNKIQYSGHEIEHFTARDQAEFVKRRPQGKIGRDRAEQKTDARSIAWMQDLGLLPTPFQSQTGYTFGRWFPEPKD